MPTSEILDLPGQTYQLEDDFVELIESESN